MQFVFSNLSLNSASRCDYGIPFASWKAPNTKLQSENPSALEAAKFIMRMALLKEKKKTDHYESRFNAGQEFPSEQDQAYERAIEAFKNKYPWSAKKLERVSELLEYGKRKHAWLKDLVIESGKIKKQASDVPKDYLFATQTKLELDAEASENEKKIDHLVSILFRDSSETTYSTAKSRRFKNLVQREATSLALQWRDDEWLAASMARQQELQRAQREFDFSWKSGWIGWLLGQRRPS